MLGPTGIGVLWAREELLEAMPPFLGGGEMIRDVRLDGFTPNEIPWKFEAGTPPIAEAIGLGAAIALPRRRRARADPRPRGGAHRLRDRAAHRALRDEITIFGPTPDPERRAGVISFAFGDVHPHDVAQVLDQQGICVRAGHHCAKPLMRRLGVAARRRGHRSTCTTTRRTSTRSSTRSPPSDSSSPDGADRKGPQRHGRPRRPLPRDHPRPLPLAPEPGRAPDARLHTGSRGSTRSAATRSSSTWTSTTASSPTSGSPGRAARSASPRRR